MIEIDKEKFYTFEFDAFDKIGVFKVSIVHNKKGFYMNEKDSQKQVIIREYFQE